MKADKVVGLAILGLDTIGDVWFAIDLAMIVSLIDNTYTYGDKIYDATQSEYLAAASWASIIFAVLGIIMAIIACWGYVETEGREEDRKDSAKHCFTASTFVFVDIPMILIVVYISYQTNVLTTSGIISLIGDAAAWIYKGWTALITWHNAYNFCGFDIGCICTFNLFAWLISMVGLLIMSAIAFNNVSGTVHTLCIVSMTIASIIICLIISGEIYGRTCEDDNKPQELVVPGARDRVAYGPQEGGCVCM